MNLKTSLTAQVALFALILTTFGCGGVKAPSSPLQSFYQSLSAIQATVQQIEANTTEAAKYKVEINAVVRSYNVAEAAFQTSLAQQTGDTTALATDVALLVDQVALLVATFQPSAARVRFNTKAVQAHDISAKLSFQDILTILTLAAAAARDLPGASPYAGLAALILQAADAGIAAFKGSAGAINASTLSPLTLVP